MPRAGSRDRPAASPGRPPGFPPGTRRPRWRSAVTSLSSSLSPAAGLHLRNDARMEHVGAGQLHQWMIGGMHAIEAAETGGPEVLTYVEKPRATWAGSGGDQGRGYRGQFHRHLFPVGAVQARGAVRVVGTEVRHRRGRRRGCRQCWPSATGWLPPMPTARTPTTAWPRGSGGLHVPDGWRSESVASALLKGMTAHYLDQSVYPAALDTIPVHAGAGGSADPDPVGHQHGHSGDHHRVDAPEKAALSWMAGAVEVGSTTRTIRPSSVPRSAT